MSVHFDGSNYWSFATVEAPVHAWGIRGLPASAHFMVSLHCTAVYKLHFNHFLMVSLHCTAVRNYVVIIF